MPQQSTDPTDPSPTDSGAGVPTQPEPAEEAEVQGYTMIICSACMHMHGQLDPKCNIRCMHGSSFRAAPGTIPTTY